MRTKLEVSRLWNNGTIKVSRLSYVMMVNQHGDESIGIPIPQWNEVLTCTTKQVDDVIDMYVLSDPSLTLVVNGHDFSLSEPESGELS